MNIEMLSFEKVCDLLEEQRELNDLFNVTSMGPHAVMMSKDDCHGYDDALQKFGCRCGVSAAQFHDMQQDIGFLIISKQGVLQSVG